MGQLQKGLCLSMYVWDWQTRVKSQNVTVLIRSAYFSLSLKSCNRRATFVSSFKLLLDNFAFYMPCIVVCIVIPACTHSRKL